MSRSEVPVQLGEGAIEVCEEPEEGAMDFDKDASARPGSGRAWLSPGRGRNVGKQRACALGFAEVLSVIMGRPPVHRTLALPAHDDVFASVSVAVAV